MYHSKESRNQGINRTIIIEEFDSRRVKEAALCRAGTALVLYSRGATKNSRKSVLDFCLSLYMNEVPGKKFIFEIAKQLAVPL